MIEKAGISQLKTIKNLTEACAKTLQEKGIFQWNEHYPSRQKLTADLQKKELYILKKHDEILGIVALSFQIDAEYLPVSWISPTAKNLYVHRLAVHPKQWGNGYARQLMDFAEDFARKNNCISVRLDTFSQNKRNQKFYEARKYQKLGKVFFPQQSKYPFYCYELVL